jgi:hypothetical protein
MQDWKKQLSERVGSDEKLDDSFLEEGTKTYALVQDVLKNHQFGDVVPEHDEIAQGVTRVCKTLSEGLIEPVIAPGGRIWRVHQTAVSATTVQNLGSTQPECYATARVTNGFGELTPLKRLRSRQSLHPRRLLQLRGACALRWSRTQRS